MKHPDKKKQPSEEDELMGQSEQVETADDSSDDDLSSDDETRLVRSKMPPVGPKSLPWVCAFSQGMNTETWLEILHSLSPPKAILVTAFTKHPGLLMAALLYNDERFGLVQCPLVCFHPDGKQSGRSENAHIADHCLLQVMRTYQKLHDQIVDQASKRALRRNPSNGPAPQADQFQQTSEAEDPAIVQASAKKNSLSSAATLST